MGVSCSNPSSETTASKSGESESERKSVFIDAVHSSTHPGSASKARSLCLRSVLFDTVTARRCAENHGEGAHMGDKSPKSKDKNKKQQTASKDKKTAASAAATAAKRKDTSK